MQPLAINHCKRHLRASLLAACFTLIPNVQADEPVRRIELLSRPQAQQPQDFQTVQLVAREWRRLGLDVKVTAAPWEKLADWVWRERNNWDAVAWPMVGRPERSDPDELVYNLYHSSTAPAGYNIFGYQSAVMDRLVEAQRLALNPEERRTLLYKAQSQAVIDQPAIMLVHPQTTYAFDHTVWDAKTVVEQTGVGIKNFWTFVGIEPLGNQKDLIVRFADRMKGINPLWIAGDGTSAVTELVWDRLMRVAPDGTSKPWAAKSVERVDPITYLVTMRDDLKWHDGRPVTVDDVVFSIEGIKSGEAPQYLPFVSRIANVVAAGDKQIRITLTQPTAAFLTATLAKINLIPRHIWGPIISDLEGRVANAEEVQNDIPIGSGPYRFVSWRRGQEVVLARNDAHFSPPKAERVIMRIVPNTEAAVGMLRAGDVNFLTEYNGDPKVLSDFANRDGDITVVSTADIGSRFIAFNHRRPPFDDPAFRRALSAAIDRKLIVAAAYRGAAVPSHSLVSPALPNWYDPEADKGFKTGFDEARRILTDAGYHWVNGQLHHAPTAGGR